MPDFDIERARAETPGCAHVLHFNNAGAALMPAPVLAAQVNHLKLEARMGGYEAAAAAHQAYEHTYDALARLLHCTREEVALGVAVDYALDWGLDAIQDRVQRLAEDLRERLATVSGVTVHDLGRARSGIVTFSSTTLDAGSLRQRLSAQGINVSISVPNSTFLDAEDRGLPEMVRASVHYYNTQAEVNRFCGTLEDMVRQE